MDRIDRSCSMRFPFEDHTDAFRRCSQRRSGGSGRGCGHGRPRSVFSDASACLPCRVSSCCAWPVRAPRVVGASACLVGSACCVTAFWRTASACRAGLRGPRAARPSRCTRAQSRRRLWLLLCSKRRRQRRFLLVLWLVRLFCPFAPVERLTTRSGRARWMLRSTPHPPMPRPRSFRRRLWVVVLACCARRSTRNLCSPDFVCPSCALRGRLCRFCRAACCWRGPC